MGFVFLGTDLCREKQIPHRIFEQYNLGHVVPFMHEDIDKWRDSLHHGLRIKFKDTNIFLQGGVDDIWFDTKSDKLINLSLFVSNHISSTPP